MVRVKRSCTRLFEIVTERTVANGDSRLDQMPGLPGSRRPFFSPLDEQYVLKLLNMMFYRMQVELSNYKPLKLCLERGVEKFTMHT